MEIGDHLLHNATVDSGASNNVTPLQVMEALGLQITRPYMNVCGIDSQPIKVHGIIKNLVAPIHSHPDISTLLDVVVIDLPPRYGLLLSRKWSSQLGGSIQNDSSYMTIPNVDGRMVRIYREPIQPAHIEPMPVSQEKI